MRIVLRGGPGWLREMDCVELDAPLRVIVDNEGAFTENDTASHQHAICWTYRRTLQLPCGGWLYDCRFVAETCSLDLH